MHMRGVSQLIYLETSGKLSGYLLFFEMCPIYPFGLYMYIEIVTTQYDVSCL